MPIVATFSTPATKALVITNNNKSSLRFVFCTQSTCRCAVCNAWIRREVQPMAKERATYGVLVVKAMQTLTARVCPDWDCVGACFFGGVPAKVKPDMLFDFDESEGYSLDGNNATLEFVECDGASLSVAVEIDDVNDEASEDSSDDDEAADNEPDNDADDQDQSFAGDSDDDFDF